MKIVKVIAEDWAQYDDTLEKTYPFKTTKAEVVGFVVKETKDIIALSHQLFPRDFSIDDVRRTTVIPKKMIKEIKVLEEKI